MCNETEYSIVKKYKVWLPRYHDNVIIDYIDVRTCDIEDLYYHIGRNVYNNNIEIKLNDEDLINIVRNINGTFTHVEFIKFNSFAQESKNIVNSIIKAMQSTFCDFETSAALITHLNNHFGLPLISVTADVNVVRNPYHTDTIGAVKIDRDGIVEIYSNTEDQQQEIIQLLENLDKSCYSIVDE